MASGRRSDEGGAEVDDLRRVAADRHLEARLERPHRPHDRLRGRAVGLTLRLDLHDGRPGAGAVAHLHAPHPGQALDVGQPAGQRRVVGIDVRDDVERLGGDRGEARVDGLGDPPRLGRLGEGLHPRVVEAGTGEGQAEEHESRTDHQHHRPRPALDHPGQPGERAVGTGGLRRPEAVPEPLQQDRQERLRRQQRGEDHADPGQGEGSDRRVVEHQQRGERDRHRAAPRTRSCGRRWPWSAGPIRPRRGRGHAPPGSG